ncbi:MAG: hypothetical protein AVDCRST_MAG91-618 [uncultured Sphingomonadaceae bacterium]|uniref:Membrane protein ykgB n=1 Tax=uncultured Sphingomonadaceae bacterium TaxID=169976 RepID=A0A6J4S917_9SPHN|nr:MAG: hypothetical protein AVDCRST_MAG91-618 [uncultured Sphingomonadaceae bacterium]
MSDMHLRSSDDQPDHVATTRPPTVPAASFGGLALEKSGYIVAATGIVVVLAVSGVGKFTGEEVEGLKPVFEGSPLLSWIPPILGDLGSNYLLGVVEVASAALIATSPFSKWAGVAGGALATVTFAVTTSLLFSPTPSIWDERPSGASHATNWGFFLLKDIVHLGASMLVLGSNLQRPGRIGGGEQGTTALPRG